MASEQALRVRGEEENERLLKRFTSKDCRYISRKEQRIRSKITQRKHKHYDVQLKLHPLFSEASRYRLAIMFSWRITIRPAVCMPHTESDKSQVSCLPLLESRRE